MDESQKSINSLQSMQNAIIWLLTGGFGSSIALARLAKALHWIERERPGHCAGSRGMPEKSARNGFFPMERTQPNRPVT